MCFSQDQNKADSLILIFQENNYEADLKNELLHGIASNHTVPEQNIYYSNLLITEAEKSNDSYWLHKGLMELGSAYQNKGDLERALDIFLKSFKAAESADYIEGKGASLSKVADVYSIGGDHHNAISYYNQAI